jgi:DUF4097 and DUF4098 domain-containing protein YvlB
MRRTIITTSTLISLALAATLASPAAAQNRDDHAFEWSGDLARGQRLYVYDINGSITVQNTRGTKLEIVAQKKWRRSRPEDVKIQATRVRGDRDVVVCAIWNDRNMDCDETGYRSRNHDGWNNKSNDVQVDFVIKLPAGAHITANTINGSVEITGASGDVTARTVNGGIDAESSVGVVDAKTVTGSIRVRMGQLPTRGVAYETVTGSVTLTLPDVLDADVDATTVVGGITSEYPITVAGSARRNGFSQHNLHGTIGRGGPRIQLKTVTGPIRLEKTGTSKMR